MKKDKDKSLLDDRRFSIPLSILLAVALWMVVTMVINPNQSTTIYNVPVDFTYNSTSYTSKGLDIVNNPQKNVSLKLEGNGYDLSGLKAEDFVVYPDYSSVNGPGEVTLPLRVLVRDSTSQVKVLCEQGRTGYRCVRLCGGKNLYRPGAGQRPDHCRRL